MCNIPGESMAICESFDDWLSVFVLVNKRSCQFSLILRHPLDDNKSTILRAVPPQFVYPGDGPLTCLLRLATRHVLRKGTNGVSTNGVNANLMFFDRVTFGDTPVT